MAGHPRQSLGFYAFLLAILLAPLGRRDDRRAVLFGLIAMAVAWIQMAITANAGGSVHHTILLWPLPQLVVGVSLAGASQRLGKAGRWVTGAALAVLVISGILVTNEYYTMMRKNGGSESWTDAIFRLNTYAGEVPSKSVICMDWGILDNLRFLSRGALPLRLADDRISKSELTPEDREVVAKILADTGNLYIAHTQEAHVFPSNERFLKLAAESGYRRESLAVIADSFGRPTFEVYRLAAALH